MPSLAPPDYVVLPLDMPDGVRFEVAVWEAAIPGSPTLLMVPAMGAPVAYYRPFLQRLQQAGYTVVATDWRGHGRNYPRVSRQSRFGYAQLLEDLHHVASWTHQRYPQAPVYLLGHSLGGQLSLLTLARHPNAADGAILVASGSVYFRAYRHPLRTLLVTQMAALIAQVWGVWPGRRFGFGGTESRGVMRDWAYQARTGFYRPRHATFNYEDGLRRVPHRILAISVQHDQLAPSTALEHLCHKLPAANITREEAAGESLDHFSWVKNCQPVVAATIQWLRVPPPASRWQ
ncbi:MAG: alpha/beta fold hydrolase [Thermaerobacter sp.]|nr:alpha/beta fold hydrolase [Thermaerobacter sp.]